MSQGALSPEPAILLSGIEHRAGRHLRLRGSRCAATRPPRQTIHVGFQVDILSDTIVTLSLQNSAGAISASDLHRAVLLSWRRSLQGWWGRRSG